MKFNKKKIISFCAALLALAIIAGSWAFYSSVSKIDNELQTKEYGDRIIEEFTPKQDLEPGKEITKKVGVTNTGDYDLVVRIKMSEKWERNDQTLISFDSDNAAFNTVTNTTYIAKQGNDTDGLLTNDETVMYKNLDLSNWTDGKDGYWYYNNKLTPGATTGNLLESVIMATNTDIGHYAPAVKYYSVANKATVAAAQAIAEDAQETYAKNPTADNKTALDAANAALEDAYGWTSAKPADETTINFVKSENVIDKNAQGYSNANYTLTIITEVCQATKDAVTATWTTGTVPADLLAKLS